jgi:type VI secretion system protein ImpA
MDLNGLLDETAKQAPCGPNLEYDPEFMSFVQALKGKPEQQFGDKVIAAEGPDWRDVERRATALLTRSKDLRVALPLARAWVRQAGLPGLADGLALTRELLFRFWDALHPELMIDGRYDSFPRANALSALGDFDGLVGDVRQACLVQIPGGGLCVREAESVLGGSTSKQQGLERGQLLGVLADEFAAGNPALRALLVARDELVGIGQVCGERMRAGEGPDVSALKTLLDLIAKSLGAESAVQAQAGDEEDGAINVTGGEPANRGGLSVGVNSRLDALHALEMARDYIERCEPANPAALFIRRAEKMMAMGFMDIIRELAPDSIGQLEMITGARQDNGEIAAGQSRCAAQEA